MAKKWNYSDYDSTPLERGFMEVDNVTYKKYQDSISKWAHCKRIPLNIADQRISLCCFLKKSLTGTDFVNEFPIQSVEHLSCQPLKGYLDMLVKIPVKELRLQPNLFRYSMLVLSFINYSVKSIKETEHYVHLFNTKVRKVLNQN